MDQDEEVTQGRYALCQAGLAITAVSIGLLCLSSVILGSWILGARPFAERIHHTPFWKWGIDPLIPLTGLVGAYLLWGRWKLPSWQRRTGLLLLMNAVDVGLWVVLRADRLGLSVAPRVAELEWFLTVVSIGLGFFELILTASLAADVSLHLGHHSEARGGGLAEALAGLGVIVWLLLATTQTRWSGWPPVFRPTHDYRVLLSALILLRLGATFLVTALCLATARYCREYRLRLRHQQQMADPFRSRSETEGDEILWK